MSAHTAFDIEAEDFVSRARLLGRHNCRSEGAGACTECSVRSVSVCAALDPEELKTLNAIQEKVDFEAKETLFLQDEVATSVYNITCGMVRLYKLLPDGRRQIVGFMLPGDFIGLSLSERNGYSADAIDLVHACRFERCDFVSFVDEKPHLLRKLHGAATHELTVAQDHMVLLGRRSAEEKVASFLLTLRDRLVRLGSSAVTIPLPMTRQDVADYLGLTLETVSRVISKFGRERVLVVVPDGIRILNPSRLEVLGAN
jgi:CRP/FNR family transcriptional regulator